jgi:hypothetical protein
MNLLNRIRAAFSSQHKGETPGYLDNRDKIIDNFISNVLHLDSALVMLTELSDLIDFPEPIPGLCHALYRLYEVDISATNVSSILDAIARRYGV